MRAAACGFRVRARMGYRCSSPGGGLRMRRFGCPRDVRDSAEHSSASIRSPGAGWRMQGALASEEVRALSGRPLQSGFLFARLGSRDKSCVDVLPHVQPAVPFRSPSLPPPGHPFQSNTPILLAIVSRLRCLRMRTHLQSWWLVSGQPDLVRWSCVREPRLTRDMERQAHSHTDALTILGLAPVGLVVASPVVSKSREQHGQRFRSG